MAIMSFAQELRARFRGRREAMAQMGKMYEPGENADCWWFHKSKLYFNEDRADHDAIPARFRDGAEALALLSVLARTDYAACVSEVRALRPSRRLNMPVSKKPVNAIGVAYSFSHTADLVPIFERVVGTDPPTQQFLDDFVWLKNAIAARGGELRVAPIPVRLNMCFTSDAFGSMLRQILQAVVTQHLHRQVPWDDDHKQVAASTRFEIVKVDFKFLECTANLETLEYLSRLTKMGVRIKCLPTIQPSPQESPSVIRHLHTLVPPSGRDAPFIRYVHVGEETSLHLVPAVFTAIQANRSVEEVAVSAQRDRLEHLDENERATACSVWKWAAYTLFSRRAVSHVKRVRLHVDYLDQLVLSTIEDVIRADNPLPVVLGTVDEGGQQWVKASRFLLGHPDGPDQTAQSWYTTEESLAVKVLATFESRGEQWRHVLLPGYGPAFVTPTGSVEVPPSDIQLPEESDGSSLDLQLEGLNPNNVDDVALLLLMMPRDVNNLAALNADNADELFDMTDWTIAVLDHFPGLKALDLPIVARLRSLQIFVDSAEAGKSRLQKLNLYEPFDPRSADLLAFLGVLSDSSHPLTQNLQVLHLVVSTPNKVPTEFTTAWFGMLKRNRTLHTVSLMVTAQQPLAKIQEKVTIRTGPLALPSKLAFLSVLQHASSSKSARTQLDVSVAATIFQFAAQHQLRHVSVEFYPD